MKKSQENKIEAALKELAAGGIEVELALEEIKSVVEIAEDDLLERVDNLIDSARRNIEKLVKRSHGGGSAFSFGGCTERLVTA